MKRLNQAAPRRVSAGGILFLLVTLVLAVLLFLVGRSLGAAGLASRLEGTPTPTPSGSLPPTLPPPMTVTPGPTQPPPPTAWPTSQPQTPQVQPGYWAENIRILAERQLTQDGQFIFMPISWSPDGTKIAASRLTGDWIESEEGLTPITQVWVLNNDGTGGQAIAEGLLPRWSPDGQVVAFNQYIFVNNQIDRLELKTIELASLQINTLAERSGSRQDLEWLGSGSEGLFARVQRQDVVRVNWDGSHPQPLVMGNALVETVGAPFPESIFFKVSPNGRWMVLGGQGLWLLDLATTPVTVVTQLTANPEGLVGGPAWSPAGLYVAFTEFDGSLHIVDPNHPESHVTVSDLSLQRSKPHWLSWSPDDQALVFEFGGNLYLVNADGSGLRQLTTSGDYDFPAWSPTGTQIAFERLDRNIWLMDIDNLRSGE